ncbi:alanine--tRNA ligase [Bacillus sp. FJAT-27916]|uniref:alanine--tRNA ligase n=1 Tax=Bacillaceae TaxID=186817 RepID=UPI0006707F54|nr:alanine--tRNA ligase [Bacillus sp. FJAT-27916]KMY43671.1 alanine--tRNA ligase [Bacillus sp. FJAT-27916]
MRYMTGAEIRQMFLDFFQEKGHRIEPSASLVPVDDPTLLWINSGVATLKKYFDGRVIPDNPRITNAQKSIRTNDIENVGKTARHHTFFEMLGNFSIGEYFREDAIKWGWELLTSEQWFAMPKDKLYITYYPADTDSYDVWRSLGVPDDHLIPLEDNFWEIGEGPSGPDTEIFFDRGTKYDPENIGIRMIEEDIENDRYIEIWNIVLSQFNANPEIPRSEYPELPKKNIDTGMGLERMASIFQDGETNFDTDLFLPIIHKTEEISGQKYRTTREKDVAFRVIADHIRTVAFAVGDGALPSNEGRGYVLRRLLRRAVRFAKKIGINKPFMYELVPVVADIMVDYYPEVKKNQDFIAKVIRNEEERFHETLHDGLAILSEVIQGEKKKGSDTISGSDIFRLYDTYGFPVELTEEYAEDEGMKVDHAGFEKEMEAQRSRARAARQDVDSMQVQSGILGDIKVDSEFIGYDQLECKASVSVIIKNGERAEDAMAGEEVQIIFDRTPFYAESGGQIADRGFFENDELRIFIKDVQKAPNGQNLHTAVVEYGLLKEGTTGKAQVDAANRSKITKNHTATHLLHQALKDVLGTHVNQAGSLVQPDRLRFDFSHFGQVTAEELERIEQIVNDKIWKNIDVSISNKAIAEAKAMGAMALFGEKYGDIVRVVQVGDYSLELCGGCHVPNTSAIGLFKIVSESGIGAGTRRIEAVTGEAAYQQLTEQISILREAAAKVKANPKDLPGKIDSLLGEVKDLQKENESLAAKLSNIEAGNIQSKAETINGVTVLSAKVQAQDMNNLRNMADDLKQKLGSSVIVLGSVQGDKVNLIAAVTKDLVDEGYHAGKIIKEVATRCGGGGGGRPDMAQAGGKNPNELDAALAAVKELVEAH